MPQFVATEADGASRGSRRPDEFRAAPEVDAPGFAEFVQEGFLFIDGKYVPPPYRLQAADETMTINGKTYAAQLSNETIFLRQIASGEHLSCSMYLGAVGGPSNIPDAGDQRLPPETFLASAGRPNTRWATRRLAETLSAGGVVVAFQKAPVVMLTLPSEQFEFYQALLAAGKPTGASQEQKQRFLQLSGAPLFHDTWRNWLSDFRPPGQLVPLMEERVEVIAWTEAQNRKQNAASRRLDVFSYPLTVAGMVLGVLSLGNLLKWSGRGFASEGEGCSLEIVRFAELALILMVGMSVIDLVWTILAAQAGQIQELNPIAARFVHSPLALVLFKASATALSCGILFGFRRRRQIQHAIWWMCLVCVLVTFRWVVFDALFV